MNYKKIIVTTDFSNPSYAAFETAAYEAKMEGSEVTLLHVLKEPLIPAYMYEYLLEAGNTEEYVEQILSDTNRKLEELVKEHFHGQKVKTKLLRAQRGVGTAIAEYAEKENINLIIISSHGRSRIGKILLGSVAERVLHFAPCPVLVVPTRKIVEEEEQEDTNEQEEGYVLYG